MDMDDLDDDGLRMRLAELRQDHADLDAAVGPVGGVSGQPQFESPRPGPPPEPHPLDVTVHPRGESNLS